MTLLVSIFGGPGIGKSTVTALVFAKLKQYGWNVECAHEYAKDLTWEGHTDKLAFQPLVAAKQMWRLERLDGKVDAIITDTSTLLACIYGTPEGGATPAMLNWIVDDYKRRNTLNIMLMRDPYRAYNPKGRNQTEEEAKAADQEIRDLLHANFIPYTLMAPTCDHGGMDGLADAIVREVTAVI